MEYKALYRKYRPSGFSGVVGQDSIVETLKNQIETGRISHAYLFCGTRGTGKTSVAKIFAKALNCTSAGGEKPCGKCQSCMDIANDTSLNVMEIDGASNNGVSNVREIRENAKYTPANGGYKVYIIDEVHMLSAEAFNAFLKTLEEPPAHVVFILATTDPQKIPVTILSRCQRFDFRRITSDEMVKTIKKYLQYEKVKVTDEALFYIANMADGSMRDALSLLDQSIAFYFGEEITLPKLLLITGAVDDSCLFDMLEALKDKNAEKSLALLDGILSAGRDINRFISEFIMHLRNLLVAKTVVDSEKTLPVSPEKLKRIKEQSKRISAEELIYFITVFSELPSKIRFSASEKILLETELIKICCFSESEDNKALAARIAFIERQLESGAFAKPAESCEEKAASKESAPGQAECKNTVQDEKPDGKDALIPHIKQEISNSDIGGLWKYVLGKSDAALKAMLSHVTEVSENGEMLTLLCDSRVFVPMIKNKEAEVKRIIKEKTGKEPVIKYELAAAGTVKKPTGAELLENMKAIIPDMEIE